MTGASDPALRLGHEDAAIFELYVVPRYLALFADPLVQKIVTSQDARVCHVDCRTGYPDQGLFERLPGAHVYGCDPSSSAIELARAKGAPLELRAGNVVLDYRVVPGFPLPFPPAAFSHAFTVHPCAHARHAVLDELARLLAPRGQVLVAMPLRGSFTELHDLLRECALKHELPDLGAAVEAAAELRPDEALFQREIADAGFTYVEVEARRLTLPFESGAAFFADPTTRLLLLPELRADLARERRAAEASAVRPMPIDPLSYVKDAIDKYWSGRPFDLSLTNGVASGRRA